MENDLKPQGRKFQIAAAVLKHMVVSQNSGTGEPEIDTNIL